MDSINLYHYEDQTIKVTVDAFFNKNGDLVVEGYDIGRKVEEYWGDSDYEYSTTIAAEETRKLCVLFDIPPGSRNALLAAIQKRYHTNSCYSEFQQLLEENGIKYEGFSWR